MRTATSPATLLVAAVAAALGANLVVQAAYGALPPLPVFAGIVLGVLGLAEVLLAELLYARIQRRPGTRPVDPLQTAQAVALAKASSLGGALVGGAWLGILAYLLPLRDELTAAVRDTPGAVVGAVGAAVLVGAGLWLEHRCRTPDEPERDPS